MASVASMSRVACTARAAAPSGATRAAPASPAFLSGRALRVAAPKASTSGKKFVVRAESSEFDADKMVKDLTAKWDAVENKSTVAVYAGGAFALVWFSSTIIGAVNSVPLLPKLLELVGLGYTAWFVYRYLLFKSSREELIDDVEELKKKITGPDASASAKPAAAKPAAPKAPSADE